ncbi:MAG: hypothetical protein CMK56_03670 [Proteobacteria bacterium]|nr:hypothetical protein [Pseudomonadota bacterium]
MDNLMKQSCFQLTSVLGSISFNKSTLLIFAFFLLMFENPTFAATRWALIQQQGNGDRVFIDHKSKLRVGNMITLWMLEDYRNAQQDYTRRWYSVASKNIFDCPGRVFRRIHTSHYNGSMGFGQIVRARLLNSKWKPVTNGKLFAAICEGFKKDQ